MDILVRPEEAHDPFTAVETSELLADERIVGARATRGQLPELWHRDRVATRFGALGRRAAHRADTGLESLVGKQRNRSAPPAVHLTDDPVLRDSGAVEEHLVELRFAGHLHERPNGHTFLLNRENEHRDPPMLRRIGIRPCQENRELAVLGAGGPDLLSTDYPLVAVELGPRRQRGKIRTRAGLGVHLAPDLLAPQTRADEAFLQRITGVIANGRQRHTDPDPEGRILSGNLASALLREYADVVGGQAPTAISHWVVDPGEAFVEQQRPPRLRSLDTARHLVEPTGQRPVEEVTNLSPEIVERRRVGGHGVILFSRQFPGGLSRRSLPAASRLRSRGASGSERPVADEGDPLDTPMMAAVVRDGVVLGAAVVPLSDASLTPPEPALELGDL